MSALGAGGCGGDDPAQSRVPGGDAAVDVEAGVDATVDGALDAGVDGDSGADATLDASDATTEASNDAATEASDDAASDGSDDAAADGSDDAAEPDAGDASEPDASDAETGVDGGDGGPLVCTPGHTEPCYSGPAGTLGVGACKAGIEVCLTDGSGYGACFGEVTPVAETCATAVDDDCDGEVNEEGDFCVCSPGHTIECYTGPAGTGGVGLCSPGVRSCNTLGSGYGVCQGEVLPAPESCATYFDEDCDRVPECPGDVKTVTTLGLGPGDELLAVDKLQYENRTAVAVRRAGLSGTNEVIDFLHGGGMQVRYIFPTEAVPTSMWGDTEYRTVAGVYSGAPDLGTGPLPQAPSGLFAMRQHVAGHSYWVAGRAATFWMPATVWAAVPSHLGEPIAILSNATAIDFGSGLQATSGPTIVYERLLLPYDYPPRPLKLAGTGTVTALALNAESGYLFVTGTVSGTADLGTGLLTNGAFVVRIWPSTGVATLLKFAPLDGVIPAKHHAWLPMLVGHANSPYDYGTGVLPAGMIVLPLYTSGVMPWSRSVPGCTPLDGAGYVLSEAVVFVIAQCTSSVDLGSGLVPPGRVLFRFAADPAKQWARPLPASGWDPAYVVHGFPLPPAHGPELIGVASTPLDFGTGPPVYGSSVFVAHSVPWQ